MEAFAAEFGMVERQRKLDVVMFTREAVISANTSSGGMQADALRAYSESGATRAALKVHQTLSVGSGAVVHSLPSVLDSLRGIGGNGRPPPPRRRPEKSAPAR